VVAVTAVALAAACGPVAQRPDEPQVKGKQRSLSSRIVVAITVDGLTSSVVTELGREQLPAFHRMMRQGSSTLNARTAIERTLTMPNHSGVFTGRRVLGTFGHQVTFNNDSAGTDLHTVAGRYVPSMFDVIHDRGGRVRFFAGKEKFAFFDRSWDSERGAVDTTGVDNGRDKIDRYVYDEDTRTLVDRVVRTLRKRPAKLTYLHIRLPDSAGHRYGWGSAEYRTAVRQSSAQVGRILRTIARRDKLRSRAAVVLTSDHGGEGKGHADSGRPINYTVPFMAWGTGVARCADLYDLNPERVDPGTTQPTYFSGAPPVRNLDMASLVTTHLGYGKVRGGTAPHTTPLQVR
jgi:hypothetical protein